MEKMRLKQNIFTKYKIDKNNLLLNNNLTINLHNDKLKVKYNKKTIFSREFSSELLAHFITNPNLFIIALTSNDVFLQQPISVYKDVLNTLTNNIPAFQTFLCNQKEHS